MPGQWRGAYITPGDFNVEVQILAPTVTRDSGTNESIETWEPDRDPILCAVDIKRGREFFQDGKRFSETVAEIIGHHFDFVPFDSTYRLRIEGQDYDVKSFIPDLKDKQYAMVDAVRTA